MKLYWRVKKDGKWTWRPAVVHDSQVFKYIGIESEDPDQPPSS